MQGRKKSVVFFDHRGLVNNDALEASPSYLLSESTGYCCHDAREGVKDYLFKIVLVLHEYLELRLFQLFDLLDVEAKKSSTIRILF